MEDQSYSHPAKFSQVISSWKGGETPRDLTDVGQHLLALEKRSRKLRQSIPLKDLLGHWRLVYVLSPEKNTKQAAPAQPRQGRLVPRWLSIQLSFQFKDLSLENLSQKDLYQSEDLSPSDGDVESTQGTVKRGPTQVRGCVKNQVNLGLVSLTLSGPFCYHPQQSILAFDFLNAAYIYINE